MINILKKSFPQVFSSNAILYLSVPVDSYLTGILGNKVTILVSQLVFNTTE